MTNTSSRWMLAYDATCGTCRKISRVVRRASASRLDVVPLDRPSVREWRTQALGDSPPWRPTLLRIHDGVVSAWTGPGIAAPLIGCLGLKYSIKVMYALGKLRTDKDTPAAWARLTAPPVRLCVGATIAAGLLLTGKAPAGFAREKADAAGWVSRNRDRLPHTYDDIMTYPQAYRIAIFAASPPAVQSHFWIEALKRERHSRSGLSPAQDLVFAEAIELAGQEDIFTPTADDAELARQLADLKDRAVTEFATPGAYGIFLKLGELRPTGSRPGSGGFSA